MRNLRNFTCAAFSGAESAAAAATIAATVAANRTHIIVSTASFCSTACRAAPSAAAQRRGKGSAGDSAAASERVCCAQIAG